MSSLQSLNSQKGAEISQKPQAKVLTQENLWVSEVCLISVSLLECRFYVIVCVYTDVDLILFYTSSDKRPFCLS